MVQCRAKISAMSIWSYGIQSEKKKWNKAADCKGQSVPVCDEWHWMWQNSNNYVKESLSFHRTQGYCCRFREEITESKMKLFGEQSRANPWGYAHSRVKLCTLSPKGTHLSIPMDGDSLLVFLDQDANKCGAISLKRVALFSWWTKALLTLPLMDWSCLCPLKGPLGLVSDYN